MWYTKPPKYQQTFIKTTWILAITSTISCVLHRPVDAQGPPHHSQGEDGINLSERDLSPDILATSVPFPAKPGETDAEIGLHEPSLHLRSSSHNISGVGGYPLLALPIMSSDLVDLLSKTRMDLSTRASNQTVSSYQYRTKRWSFSIMVAKNATMQNAAFRAVLARFLKLSSTRTTGSDEIVSTRVGVILRDSSPIADITIMPCPIVTNSSYVPFANFGRQRSSLSTTQPVEIMKVTPFGSSCAYQVVNETAALAPYMDYGSSSALNLTARSLETEILIRVGEAIFRMSMHLLHDQEGFPREVSLWAFQGIILVGYMQIVFAMTMELFDSWPLVAGGFEDDERGFDTGFYVVGRLLARLIIWTTYTAIHMIFDPRGTWKEILAALLRPLEGLGGFENAWATEGEIYGPSNSTEDARELVARWQIWMGDYDDWDG